MAAAAEATGVKERESILPLFTLSEKMKSAVKSALALTLAYLIPFSQGWEQASTAVIAIIVISTTDTGTASYVKGFFRIVGTLLGAVIGMALIAWIPQDRMLYLAILSLCILFFMYLTFAYRGDTTIFFLTALTMMMVFDGGEVDGIFLYGTERTFMTMFGVVIFTLVGLLLWPQKRKEGKFLVKMPSLEFHWLDPESFQKAFTSFLVFWGSTLLWIFLNPPGGFLIVSLATSLTLVTALSPVKPSMLIFAFTVGFVFAIFAYVFILPNIHHGWSLALFLFGYAFFGYYVFKPMLALFYLLGLPIMNIQNVMFFHFGLFLNTLFIFYLFLFVLLFFYYIPFPTQPERMFLRLLGRFRRMIGWMEEERGSFKKRYAEKYLMPTVKKMQVWASQIDYRYFAGIDAEALKGFLEACEAYVQALLEKESEAVERAKERYMETMKTIDFDILKESRF